MAETKTYTQEEFQKMYLQLCKLTGWQHEAIPTLVPQKESNGNLISVRFIVVPYEEEPKL